MTGMMVAMSGKASGRTASTTGVLGRFTATFRGYAAAVSWRDGQSTSAQEREAWLITTRGGHTWAIPPGPARDLAEVNPLWFPDWPLQLRPLHERIAMWNPQAGYRIPMVCGKCEAQTFFPPPADWSWSVDISDGRTVVRCGAHGMKKLR